MTRVLDGIIRINSHIEFSYDVEEQANINRQVAEMSSFYFCKGIVWKWICLR